MYSEMWYRFGDSMILQLYASGGLAIVYMGWVGGGGGGGGGGRGHKYVQISTIQITNG